MNWIDAVIIVALLGFTYSAFNAGLIREVIVDGQQHGLLRADINPTLAAKVIFGALDEMATNWILSERDYQLEDDAEPVMNLLLGGLIKGQRDKEAERQ